MSYSLKNVVNSAIELDWGWTILANQTLWVKEWLHRTVSNCANFKEPEQKAHSTPTWTWVNADISLIVGLPYTVMGCFWVITENVSVYPWLADVHVNILKNILLIDTQPRELVISGLEKYFTCYLHQCQGCLDPFCKRSSGCSWQWFLCALSLPAPLMEDFYQMGWTNPQDPSLECQSIAFLWDGGKSSCSLGLQHGLMWMGKKAPEILGVCTITFSCGSSPCTKCWKRRWAIRQRGPVAVCYLSLKRQGPREITFYLVQGQGMTPLGWFTWAFRQSASPDMGGDLIVILKALELTSDINRVQDSLSKTLWVSRKTKLDNLWSLEPPAINGRMEPWKVSSLEPAPGPASSKPCHVKGWPPSVFVWISSFEELCLYVQWAVLYGSGLERLECWTSTCEMVSFGKATLSLGFPTCRMIITCRMTASLLGCCKVV